MDFDYVRFTERFRGATEEIRERRRSYVPRFEGLSNVVDAAGRIVIASYRYCVSPA
jgi:hypothetical protein